MRCCFGISYVVPGLGGEGRKEERGRGVRMGGFERWDGVVMVYRGFEMRILCKRGGREPGGW